MIVIGVDVVFIGNGPVVWYSKRQTNVAQSSAEAEFIAKLPVVRIQIL